MGVHGLWKLIDSAGKPIPLEALENRILAVDVSIWLYQLVKGFQESAGHSIANAYLLGLFHRICKLLFYRIKPIFVFDGGVPVLKRRTIAERQNSRNKANLLSEKLRQSLLENLAKQEALGKALGENVVLPKMFQPKQDSLFDLPPLPNIEDDIESGSDSEPEQVKYRYKDIHSIDITSEEFLSLPADMRHDILNELKETRKQNSWAKLHLMPQAGGEFSDFQMRRLLKRRAVQVGIEQAESEMGTRGFTLSDLQSILSDQGVEVAQRIASDNSTLLLYNNKIKDVPCTKKDSEENSLKSLTSTAHQPKRKKTGKPPKTDYEEDIFDSSEEYSNFGGNMFETCTSTHDKSKTKKENFDKPGYEEEVVEDLEEVEHSDTVSQAEILEIIKRENQSSTRENPNERIPGAHLESKNVKTEGGTTLAANVEAVENESENNEVKLEHGSLSWGDDYCGPSSSYLRDLGSSFPTGESSALKKPLAEGEKKGVGKVSDLKIKQEPIDFSFEEKPIKEPISPMNTFKRITPDSRKNYREISEYQPNLISKKETKQEKPNDEDSKCEDMGVLSNSDIQTGVNKDVNSESDDDFIEVDNSEDLDTINIQNSPSLIQLSQNQEMKGDNKVTSANMEIIVQPVSKLDDDLFADVFSCSDPENRNDNLSKKNEKNKPDVGISIKSSTDIVSSLIKEPENMKTFDSVHSKALKNIELVVNPRDTLDDDLFTDVFENNVGVKNNSENVDKHPADEVLIEPKSTPKGTDSFSSKDVITKESEKSDIIFDKSEEFTDFKDKPPSPVPQLSVDEIMKIKKDLEKESSYLFSATIKEEKIASTITEQIRVDAQELLQLFGIPYIIAPMEAEAQCAYLDLTGQTQGTITDDSDIWLFGGKNVYRNFFDQKKFVQQFKSTDVTRCIHIGREEMIMLALLSGSDYSLGLTGVGSVTALEIIAHYPKSESRLTPVDRLKLFAQEYRAKTLNTSISKKLKKASISDGFPSSEVVNAYLEPEVDKSSDVFTWSKPNLKEIRRYARDKFGWDSTRTDKILDPIFENLQKTKTQATMHRFFEWKFDGLEVTKSKRVENAINLLKTPSLLAPGPSKERPPIRGNMKYAQDGVNVPPKSKTPAQIAREKAAKKFQELKKQGKIISKSKKN